MVYPVTVIKYFFTFTADIETRSSRDASVYTATPPNISAQTPAPQQNIKTIAKKLKTNLGPLLARCQREFWTADYTLPVDMAGPTTNNMGGLQQPADTDAQVSTVASHDRATARLTYDLGPTRPGE